MASEWTTYKVEEIAEKTISGPFGSNIKSAEYVKSGIPVIRGFNLSGPRFNERNYVFVTETKAESLSSSIGLPNDIVFVARGTVGLVGLVPDTYEQYVLSPNLVGLRPKPGIADPYYIFYYFRSHYGQNEIHSYVSTTGVPKIARALESLRNFRVFLPPLSEQRAIACIIGALDDKIELNRRMNETLEAMARAIFKSWFVDFDPVRAKAEGQQPPGLAPHIADLFPNTFEESELGEIPKGWKISILSDISETNAKNWTARSHPEEIEYVDLSNTKWGVIESTAILAWKEAPSRARRIARVGDTIVATTRPGNGSYAFISRGGLTVSTGFAVLTPIKRIYQNFLYLAATSSENINRLANLADGHGGAYPAVRPNEVSETVIVLPNDEGIVEVFETITSPIRDRIEFNKKETSTLAALRDTLLPRLISGELRVPDAERIVGRAL